jgi:hypothetical protein
VILKVTNELSADEKHVGLTLDSLLKLHNAKAFDQRTSVLQYVIMLIYRHDLNALTFPEEVGTSSYEASRVGLDSIDGDIRSLLQGFQQHKSFVVELNHSEELKRSVTEDGSCTGSDNDNAGERAL